MLAPHDRIKNEVISMMMTRKELQDFINHLPDDKIEEVYKLVESIYDNSNQINEKFIPALNKMFNKYDKTLKNLVDR